MFYNEFKDTCHTHNRTNIHLKMILNEEVKWGGAYNFKRIHNKYTILVSHVMHIYIFSVCFFAPRTQSNMTQLIKDF